MTTSLGTFGDFLFSGQAEVYWRAAAVFLVGMLLAKIVHRRLNIKKLDPQYRHLLRRVATYTIVLITLASVLRQLGVDLSVLLGAAGLLTVALGFAAQTSMSNLISGLFLMVERPFVIDDVIRVGDTTGMVTSIDLLSTKLRTFDNLLVRIPNESMLKSNVTNVTHFPIRRFDAQIGVAYKEDMTLVKNLLLEVANRNPLCLEEPEPLIIFQGFGDSALQFQFSVWATREKFLDLRNSIQEEIKRTFDANDIEIPFPHRTLYSGSETQPFPVRVVDATNPPAAR